MGSSLDISLPNFLAIDCGYDGNFAKKVLNYLVTNGVFVRMPFTSPENRCIRVSAGTDKDLELFEDFSGAYSFSDDGSSGDYAITFSQDLNCLLYTSDAADE